MPASISPNDIQNLPATATLATVPFLGNLAGDLSHLASDTVIITILSATTLLLFGVLCRLRQLRIALERKSVALEKSERHIRLMGDNLPNVTVFQLERSEEGHFSFSYLSHGYERALGFSRDLAVENAEYVFENVYEADIPLLQEACLRAQNNLQPTGIEIRVLDVTGELKWLHISAVPHREKESLVWDGFMQDFSVTKRAEDALLEENRNFQNLFETIDDFLLICDTNGNLIHANPSVEKRLGYTGDALRSMSIFELYPEDARAEAYRMIARMQNERSGGSNLPLQTNNGRTIPVEMNMFQGSWKNKKAIFGVARDVANRQRTENALRESQQMLQLIMDTIPMSVFWKDKDSVYLGCNQTFIGECGLENVQDVVGKNPFDLFSKTLAEGVIARDQHVTSSNQPLFNSQYSHTRPDGSIGWRSATIIPLRNDTDEPSGVLGVWQDVTEQNLAEERLKRTLEDMERFNQLMRGRERRTLELKEEINRLLTELEQPKKYRTTTEDLS
ncbi:PAS domain-containing protein [Pontiella sulfatireligans]|uniref:Aerobic respiration control sensor protein ArcB n=1 Tax=Pontiella sulfatireligans TaxID=2750658 RepID=A0A6C2USX9_9BACT|nr:PAS domain S-box protein [Pontiella sulfatireligans]VGO22006.1 Aerobic respiration control sensor protein ArcB [Pontiella sulfatireligans]